MLKSGGRGYFGTEDGLKGWQIRGKETNEGGAGMIRGRNKDKGEGPEHNLFSAF